MCRTRRARVLGKRLNTHQGLRPRHKTAIATTVVRCCGCSLIYSNPTPIPEAIEQHYDIDPEKYWLNDRSEGTHFSGEIQLFQQLWKGNHTPRALDIGAGVG